MSRFREWRTRLTSPDELRATVQQLVADGELDATAADDLIPRIPVILEESSYVLSHLGAHLAIGVIFAFDVVPLPLGSISRVLWTLCSRLYEILWGQQERARVHSWRVLAITAIPIVGYFAYLIPLRARHPELSWLMANHLTREWRGVSLQEFLRKQPRWWRGLIRSVVGSEHLATTQATPSPSEKPSRKDSDL